MSMCVDMCADMRADMHCACGAHRWKALAEAVIMSTGPTMYLRAGHSAGSLIWSHGMHVRMHMPASCPSADVTNLVVCVCTGLRTCLNTCRLCCLCAHVSMYMSVHTCCPPRQGRTLFILLQPEELRERLLGAAVKRAKTKKKLTNRRCTHTD